MVVFSVLALRARGKWLRCPDCGEVFKAPASDMKTVGFGPVPAGVGVVACPKCGQTRRRGNYLRVPAPK